MRNPSGDEKLEYCKRKGYSMDYARFWISNPRCVVMKCTKPSWPPHHLKTRGAGGKDGPDNLLNLCDEHHSEIHQIGSRRFSRKYPEAEPAITRALPKLMRMLGGECGSQENDRP